MVNCISTKNMCFCEVNSLDKKTYYIVDSDALPEVFKKVIIAKELVENGTAKNVSAAIKMCDLSRSAFYKYKDSVFKAKDTDPEKVELQAVLVDRAGVLSALSGELFKSGSNIISINQTEPKNGLASVSIVIGINELRFPIEELERAIERIDGVISIKFI